MKATHPTPEERSLYLDGVLSVEERETVDAHLADCDACRRELDLLRAITRSRPGAESFGDFTAQVMTRIQALPRQEPTGTTPTESLFRRWIAVFRRPQWSGILAGAATAALLVGLAPQWYIQSQKPPTRLAQASSRTEAPELPRPEVLGTPQSLDDLYDYTMNATDDQGPDYTIARPKLLNISPPKIIRTNRPLILSRSIIQPTAEIRQTLGEHDLFPLEYEKPLPLPYHTTNGTSGALVASNEPSPTIFVRRPTYNVALDKPVTLLDGPPLQGVSSQVTDGVKAGVATSILELESGPQAIQIDLGAPHEIAAIVLWRPFHPPRVYADTVVTLSADRAGEESVEILFNSDRDNSLGLGVGADAPYAESHEGRVIDARGLTGRYLRFYSNGNSVDTRNHYIEIEVYGWPVDNWSDPL